VVEQTAEEIPEYQKAIRHSRESAAKAGTQGE
jgi:hypothetical protein